MAVLVDIVKKGSTDRSVTIRIIDSTDGTPETGVTSASGGLALWYRREGGTVTALTESDLAAVDSAHSDGGMKHLSDGEYRVDLPDAAFATGANYVDVGGAVTGMIVVGGRVRLVDFDVETATQPVNVTQIGGVAQSATDLKDFADTGYDPSAHKVAGVVLVDTTTTNTDMRGTDNAGLASELAKVPKSDGSVAWNATAVAQVQNGLATSTEVTAIQNNTRVVRVVPTVIERPDTGTVTYRIELLLYDAVGNMEAPDSAPTIALVDQGGTDLSARLDSATMTLVSTGRYRAIYTASSTDDLEQLIWAFSVIEGGATRIYGNTTLIVDTTAVDFTSADRTKLEALNTDWTDGGRLDLLIDAILEDTGTSLPALMAASALRNALGLGSANLDTQLSTISTAAVLARKLKTGNIRDKVGVPGSYEILDDDDTAVIATLTLAETTPYQQVTLS